MAIRPIDCDPDSEMRENNFAKWNLESWGLESVI